MPTEEEVRQAIRVLVSMGREWGVPEIAKEAADELPFWLKGDDDPLVVGWDIFTELLENYDAVEKAFENGTQMGFVPFAVKKVPLQDAEDVSQIALISLWRSFSSFRPKSEMSWRSWKLYVANGKLNDFLKRIYRDRGWQSAVVLYKDMDWVVDETEREHPEVAVVAERWITGDHKGKALFAARILATYNGEADYIGLSGSHMEREVGVSRVTLMKWTRQFIEEVYAENESNG